MKRIIARFFGIVILPRLFALFPVFPQGMHDSVRAATMRGENMDIEEIGQVSPGNEVAYLGGGCFWCIEAVFERIKGVHSVISGYAGGHVPDPIYQEVSRGDTGHAEVVRIEYDPAVIDFAGILDVFWMAHDPTTSNRQGADVGTQYRSIILYTGEDQAREAEKSKRALEQSGKYAGTVVTEILPLEAFYPAEEYHQDYFEKNPKAGFCRVVITPKLKKLGLE